MNKQMKTLFSVIIMLACVVFTHAEPITKRQASDIASKYVKNPKPWNDSPQTRSSKATCPPAYYAFTSSADHKFVIISGESTLNEVVAYGSGQLKDSNNGSSYFKQFLKDYERVVKAVRANPAKAARTSSLVKRKVEPLLTCKWSQYYPFNKYTPVISGQTTPTGCVATATAQMMFYHKWPKNRPKDYIASTGDEARRSATYWWDDMKNTVAETTSDRSAQAVGVLMRDIGKAVNMRYYYKGSDSNLQYTCNALRHVFNYSVKFLDKDFLPANQFHSKVMQELSEGYPILVVGGNHAFVFDGYDERGFIHINWGWAGENDGYFDINTVYMNIKGYGISGTFWDDMQALLAHPNNGKATPFEDIPRGLDARATTAFTIDKTRGTRTETFNAEINKLGSYSSVKGDLGVFTGKVGLALYDSNNHLVKVYPTTDANHTWATIFTTMNFEVNNFNFEGVANGNYRLVPVYSEVLDAKTQKSGEWVCVNGTNEMQVQLSDNEVTIETNNPKDDVVMEKVPTLLSPFYEDSGNYAAFSLTLYNSGREEVRGDLVMILKNKETGEEFNGFLLTPNVVAQRLGSTSFAIKMLSQYYNSGRVGALRTGKYDVTFSIKANRKRVEKLIPITMKEPFEVEVLPNNHEGTIEFSYVDFLVNGKEVNYSTFDLNKTAEIGLQVQSSVRGYGLRNGYHGNVYYRLLDLTTGTWIDLGVVHQVYLPCEQPNDKAQTRLTFPTSKLEANHSYEVHIEIDRNGKRVDVWNPLALRHVFHMINESTSTDIKTYEYRKKTHQRIVNLEGVRQTKAWDSLPAGIYIVDGKKILKK
mgnify:FL=1